MYFPKIILFFGFWFQWCIISIDCDCVQGKNCKLPACFCSYRGLLWLSKTPGGLNPRDIPQQILVSFDDGINVQNFGLYNRLFAPDVKNPNGCSIKATFFVDNTWTNYSMVHELYRRGMEIGVHSVTHRTPTTFWRQISLRDMRFEIRQQKLNICHKGRIPGREIRGYRSPFLETAGDVMFKVLRENRFEYESSYTGQSTTGRAPQQWPFTLDFGLDIDCRNHRCPRKRYRGFWEVPVIAMRDPKSQYICSYADSCHNQPKTKDDLLNFLWTNFEENYKGGRGPLYINLHSAFFTGFNLHYRIEAFEDFISQITELKDVFFVTYHQSIEWIRNPTELSGINNFKPWNCDQVN